jgi:hypothetical protein
MEEHMPDSLEEKQVSAQERAAVSDEARRSAAKLRAAAQEAGLVSRSATDPELHTAAQNES